MSEPEQPEPHEPVGWEMFRDAVTHAMHLEERLGSIELLLWRWQHEAERLARMPEFEVRANQLFYCISELRKAKP